MKARTLLTLLASASLAVTGVSLSGCNGDETAPGPGPRPDQQVPPADTPPDEPGSPPDTGGNDPY